MLCISKQNEQMLIFLPMQGKCLLHVSVWGTKTHNDRFLLTYLLDKACSGPSVCRANEKKMRCG